MRIVIYYFTGTGNSLAAAKKIAAVLGGCEIVPIASLANTPGPSLRRPAGSGSSARSTSPGSRRW
ncbi:hypothetical protein [Methanoculleus sp.]|jgi:hypothetical protein|uniref:hypothetical protein n=1 Tax=Methanoculleus sp. TaxID=90427 RepID=UPI002D1FADD4|nr:hypothetical protein [Methanoculleus sp.]